MLRTGQAANGQTVTSLARCIESYILAKDGNRAELLAQAFEPHASVSLDVRTDLISFPARLEGCDQISRELVAQFNNDYANVHTFCLTGPPPANDLHFSCAWLVVMTGRRDGNLRTGWGIYDWQRESADAALSELKITINAMVSDAPAAAAPVLQWAAGLAYPWCPGTHLQDHPPPLAAMNAWRVQIDEAISAAG